VIEQGRGGEGRGEAGPANVGFDAFRCPVRREANMANENQIGWVTFLPAYLKRMDVHRIILARSALTSEDGEPALVIDNG
jgi:hypothetical protein